LQTQGPTARAECRRALRAAYRTSTMLGAVPLRRVVELAAQRARLDLDDPLSPTLPGPAQALGLTNREVEVLRLLTRGYTNRDIAGHLTISVKTASVHVSHILAKLGVSRRVEAAAIGQRLWTVDLGMEPAAVPSQTARRWSR
jgi:DNA-binding NarL/FixJ family response regulator